MILTALGIKKQHSRSFILKHKAAGAICGSHESLNFSTKEKPLELLYQEINGPRLGTSTYHPSSLTCSSDYRLQIHLEPHFSGVFVFAPVRLASISPNFTVKHGSTVDLAEGKSLVANLRRSSPILRFTDVSEEGTAVR